MSLATIVAKCMGRLRKRRFGLAALLAVLAIVLAGFAGENVAPVRAASERPALPHSAAQPVASAYAAPRVAFGNPPAAQVSYRVNTRAGGPEFRPLAYPDDGFEAASMSLLLERLPLGCLQAARVRVHPSGSAQGGGDW